MGTAGALRRALNLLDGDMVLAVHGDAFIDTSLARFCQWRQSQPHEAALLVTRVPNIAGFSTVDIDPPGKIAKLNKKDTKVEAGWINTGVCLLPRYWLEQLPGDVPLSLEHDVLPYWLDRGIGAYCVHAPYVNIATPQGLAGAPAFFGSINKLRVPAMG